MVPDSTIADQLAQGVAIYESVDDDNDFLLRYLNPSGAGMTHCDAEAMRGRRLSELFPGADGFGLIDALRRVRRTGQSLRLKTNLYNDGALKLWVENRLSRLSSGLIMAVFEDRSELVALEQASAESEARYRHLFENSLVGIFTVSKDRYITDMNQRACDIFGFRSPEDAIDRSIERVHVSHETYLRFGQEVFSRIASDGVMQVEFQLKRQNGAPFWAELSGKPVNGRNREDGVIWIINDISEAKAAREALRESEERYKLAVAGANDGLWDWKVPTNEVYFSPRWKAQLGYADNEVPNAFDEWEQRVHPDDLPSALTAIEAHLRGDTPQLQTEFRMRCKDDSWRWIQARAQCVRDADGTPLRMAGSHSDIDARKRAERANEQSRRRLATVFETVQAGIVLIDLDAKQVVEANATAAAMLGMSREELIGKPCWEWLCSTPQSCPFAKNLRPIINREALFQHVAGHRVPVLKSVVPLPETVTRLVLESFVDISKQKATEQALIEARDAAEQAARAKSEFLTKMSHEIRTPMNAIIGMTRLTLETELDAEQRENLEIADASAAALLELINDILDFSCIESGHLKLEATDFEPERLLTEVLAGFSLRAAEKGIELSMLSADTVPDWVRGDRARLRQVLVNLIGNALKFTDQGEVQVRVDCEETDVNRRTRLRFRILDTGIGVPPEQRERIFDAFHQADNSDSRRFGGTGLGLSICRQLIDAMGGEIGYRPRPQGGSELWFRITLGPVARAPAASPRAVVSALEGTRCLIVDDTENNRLLLEKTLRTWHCPTCSVGSGPAALETLRQAQAEGKPFDLVLLDMMMPGLDGEQTARLIRVSSDCSAPRILVLTSIDLRERASRLRGLGIAGVLVKPISRELLRDALLTALGQSTADQHRQPPIITHQSLEADRLVGLRVLLVEDKPFNQRITERFLRGRQIRVEIAGDGAEAVAAVAQKRFDMILMDVQMPIMDGYEATRRIRAFEADSPTPGYTPIIAMTAHAMPGDRQRCLDAGMDDYVSKPIDPDGLFATIARWAGVEPEPMPRPQPEPRPSSTATISTKGETDQDAEAVVTAALARLRELFEDEDTLSELVSIFLEDAPDAVAALKTALLQRDSKAVAAAAHGLKGMVRNFGLDALGNQMHNLERRARAQDLDAAAKLLADAERRFAAICALLQLHRTET